MSTTVTDITNQYCLDYQLIATSNTVYSLLRLMNHNPREVWLDSNDYCGQSHQLLGFTGFTV